MRSLALVPGRRARCALLAGLLALAGCGSPPVQQGVRQARVESPASPVRIAPPAPPVPRARPVDVVDGNAWTDALAAVTQSLQQAALSDGGVEVMRTADNRLRLRIEAAAAFDRRGEALQPRFRRFAEDMAGILVRHPSVQVEVVGHGGGGQAAALRQAMAWALSAQRVFRAHGVGPERLAARASGPAEPEADRAAPSGRCIEFLLSDPRGH